MAFYLELIDTCDVVVFTRLGGRITSGVGKEVNWALRNGKRVYELQKGELLPVRHSVNYVSRQDTLKLYEEWRWR